MNYFCSRCGITKVPKKPMTCLECTINQSWSISYLECFICGEQADIQDVYGAKCLKHKNETGPIEDNEYCVTTISKISPDWNNIKQTIINNYHKKHCTDKCICKGSKNE